MGTPTNTPNPEKISAIARLTETSVALPLEQRITDLTDTELDELWVEIKKLSLEKHEIEHAQTVIQQQKDRLRLKTQLPQNPKNAPQQKQAVNSPVVTPTTTPAAIPLSPEKKEENKTLGQQVTGFSIGVTETIFGKENTKDWTDERKRSVGLMISFGTAALAGVALWTWIRGKKSAKAGADAAKEAKGGFLKKLLIGAGVGFGLFVGIKFLRGDYTIDKLKDGAKDAYRTGKEKLEKIVHPWEVYGLEKEEYERALEIYRSEKEAGVDKIEEIFKVKKGMDNPQYDRFMEEIRQKYTTHEIDGIHYARADIALYNYEQSLQTAVKQTIQWMDDHWTELFLAGVALSQLGALRTILTTGVGGALTCMKFAKEISTFGIKSLTKHPFMSLMLLGGSVYALKEAKENIYLPENLSELSKAATKINTKKGGSAKIIQGKTKSVVTEKMELEIHEQAENLGAISNNYPAWLQEKVDDFLGLLVTELPNAIALTPEEIVAKRTNEGISTLSKTLENLKVDALASTEKVKAGMPEKYKKALEQLEIFRQAYILHRCNEETNSDAPQKEFEILRTLLKEVGIEITIENEIVSWKDADMQKAFDLCIDPSIKNKNQIYRASDGMRQNESDISYIGSRMMEHLRELQQEALDKGQSLPWMKKSGIMGMAVGNLFYCFEYNPATLFIDTGNVANYVFAVPFKAFCDLVNTDKTWTDTGSTFAKGAITSIAFSIGMAPMTLIKRLAIGGGPMVQYSGKYLKQTKGIWKILNPIGRAFRHTPIVSQVLYAPQAWGAYGDVKTVRRLGWLPGRFVNEMCRKGGIRPEWALALEDAYAAKDAKKMVEIGGKLQKGFQNTAKSIDDLYLEIRHHFAERLEHVNMREWSKANWGTRLKGIEIGNGDEAYEWILGKKQIPATPPAPTKAPFVLPDDLELTKVNPHATTAPHSSSSANTTTTQPQPNPSSNASNAPGGSQPQSQPTTAPHSSSSASNAAEGLDAAKVKKVDALLDSQEMTKAFADAGEKGAEAKNILRTQLLNTPDDALDVLNNPTGKKLLMGAIESSQEVEQIVKAAQKTQEFMSSMKWCAVGATLDVVGVMLIYFAIQDNNAKIRATNNPMLKRAYENSNFVYKIEGGIQSIVGISTFGVGVYTLVTGGPLMIGGLSAAVALGPISIGVAIGSTLAAHETQELKRLDIRYATTERDLEKESSGQILKYIDESKGLEDTKLGTAFVNVFDTASMGIFGSFQDANFQDAETLTRAQGYRAYFAQVASSQKSVGMVSLLDIDPEILVSLQKMDKENRLTLENPHLLQHMRNMQRERIAAFVWDAEEFISFKTEKRYDHVDAAILEKACAYANVQQEKRNQDSSIKPFMHHDEKYRANAEQRDVDKWRRDTYLRDRNALVAVSDHPEILAATLPELVLELVRHDMAVCEENVLSSSYSGSWLGVEKERMAARGNYAEQIRMAMRTAVQKAEQDKKKFDYKEMDQVIMDIKTILAKAPNDMAKDAESNYEYFASVGSSPARLTISGIKDLIQTYTLIKPQTLSASPENAFSTKSIEYYYSDQLSMKNRMPILMPIPVGQKGYLRIDGPLWMSSRSGGKYEKVSSDEGVKILELESDHYYSFRRKNSLHFDADSNGDNTMVAVPNTPADFEIITGVEEKNTNEPTYQYNPNLPAF